ncbi:MAG TPA: sulfate transporter CysZ [Thioalkalivibrio sp.]|nr:sulfate transporter CysZ [Thioalkalivibrio sp.]
MLKDLLAGMRFARRGFGLITLKGVRRYVAIPLLINIVLFTLGIWYLASEFGAFMDRMLPDWLDWARWVLWPLFAVTMSIAVFYTFTVVANLISAPFNALLAEKLEAKLTGQPLDGAFSFRALAKTVKDALVSELRKTGYLLLWLIPLLILFLIPGLNLLAPFAWAAFGAWMLAIEYADYPMGNHGMIFTDERHLLARERGLAFGFGGSVLLMTMIPVLNFLAMPVGVAGATAMWVDRLRHTQARLEAKR